MSVWLALLLFALGTVLVVAGTEWFIEGAVGLARRLGTSAFALAVIGFGAEPETLVASLGAATHGLPSAALGSVIGSSTFLALAAVGLGALVAPFTLAPTRAHRLGLLMMAGAPLILAALAFDGRLSRVDGAVLSGLAPLYGWGLWRASASDAAPATARVARKAEQSPARLHLFFWSGLVALSIGAELLGRGADGLIDGLALQETFVGVIVIAIAISLEELPRMWVPVRKGYPELAVANAIGTTLFLASLCAGPLALTFPMTVDETTRAWHVPWMVGGCAFAAAAVARGGIGRRAGALLFLLYVVYVVTTWSVSALSAPLR